MSLMEVVHRRLLNVKKNLRFRTRHIIERREHNNITIQGKIGINFSSNDYLGLTQHPDIQQAFIKGIKTFGTGSGSSPLLSGYSHYQATVESQFATFLKCEKVLLFNSGYLANIGVLSSLLSRSSTVFSDKLCHASLLDGIQLSRARHYRYPHQDVIQLNTLLHQHPASFIVSESIFSMEGNLTPLMPLYQVTQTHGSALILDDAHGIGFLGEQGRGILDRHGLTPNDIGCLIAPLGKAWGVMGAIVAGRETIIEAILQQARSYRYSTAFPPALACAISAALNVIQQETWRSALLRSRIHFFNQEASKYFLRLVSFDITPIRAIYIPLEIAETFTEKIWAKGFFVGVIRPPTVPVGTSRLRISLNALHTEEEIRQLIQSVVAVLIPHE